MQTNEALYRDSRINIRFSGSTCVSVLIVGTKVFCSNVGDSRAVLARFTNQSPVKGQKAASNH
jgi:serine/threonine protein phosphatase PrpC